MLMVAAWALLREAISHAAGTLSVAVPQGSPSRSQKEEGADADSGGYLSDSDEDGALLMGGPPRGRAAGPAGTSEDEDDGMGMVVDLGWLNRRLVSRTWEHASIHLMLQVSPAPESYC